MANLNSKDRLAGTFILHLSDLDALIVMNALAELTHTISEGHATYNDESFTAYEIDDVYQEVGRQLFNQDWGKDADEKSD